MKTVGMGAKPKANKKDAELARINKDLQKENEALHARIADLESKEAKGTEPAKQ